MSPLGSRRMSSSVCTVGASVFANPVDSGAIKVSRPENELEDMYLGEIALPA